MNAEPIAEVQLVMSEWQSVEIGDCPKCRGVWLDRGGLDKIIERSAIAAATSPAGDTTPGGRDGPGRTACKADNRERGASRASAQIQAPRVVRSRATGMPAHQSWGGC